MEKYQQLKQIGKGSFGIVYKIRRKSDGRILIWKKLNYAIMLERQKKQLVSQVNILRQLKHPNIVRYYDRIIDKQAGIIYIVMQYCQGGDFSLLLKKIKKQGQHLLQDVIWKIFAQTLMALNQCHSRNNKILHRDIKPANIFLDKQMNVKLGDFGLSKMLNQQSQFAKSQVGTPYYMSPQQIKESLYNQKSDIWSLGCLLYQMAALKPPFQAKNKIQLAYKILQGKIPSLPIRYSQRLNSVIKQLLTVNPSIRPDCKILFNNPYVYVRIKQRKLLQRHNLIKKRQQKCKNSQIYTQAQENKQNRQNRPKSISVNISLMKRQYYK